MNRFPPGILVTLILLWLALVAVTVWGVYVLLQPPAAGAPSAKASAAPQAVQGGSAPRAVSPGGTERPRRLADQRVVWSRRGLWRLLRSVAIGAFTAIVYLIGAVAVGMLVQERAESTHE